MEELTPVPNFPGYACTRSGKVYSCNDKSKKWRELQGGIDKDGYKKLILCRGGKRHYLRRCAVILITFVGPRPVGMVARHFPVNNNQDDRVDNLSWSTQKENLTDKIAAGTSQIGERHGGAKLTEEKVRKIRQLSSEGASTKSLAMQFGVKQVTIHAIVSRRLWRHI